MDALDVTTASLEANGRTITIVNLVGYLDSHTAPKFLDAMDAVIHQGTVNIIVDMAEVNYMSSAGFGVLAGTLGRLEDKQGTLIVAGLSDKLNRIFETLGLVHMIHVEPDRHLALDAFKALADPEG